MRIFTAIPLPNELKETVTELTRGRLPVPYINTSNLHITLNFFGELTDADVDKAKKAFEVVAKGQQGFKIEFDKLVIQRDQIHLTILPSEELSNLETLLQKFFIGFGFKLSDKPYYPHVKLTNLHMDKVMNPERKLDDFPHEELKQLNFRADRIVLYESKLLLHHPKYIPLIEFNLI